MALKEIVKMLSDPGDAGSGFYGGIGVALSAYFGWLKLRPSSNKLILQKLDALSADVGKMATREEVVKMHEEFNQHMRDHATGQFGRPVNGGAHEL